MNLKMQKNLVLCEKLVTERTVGGIFYHPSAMDDDKLWLVLQAGPGAWRHKKGKPPVFLPMEVRPGDKVVVESGKGHRYATPDGYWKIFDAENILAVIGRDPGANNQGGR